MKKFALLVLASMLLRAPSAEACDTEVAATPVSECVVTARAGVRGVWFQLRVADELRRASVELPELERQVLAYEQALVIRDIQLNLLREARNKREAVLIQAVTANGILTRDARRAREERDAALKSHSAWYRSPFLWFGVGVGTTLITGYALSQAF